VFVGPKSVIILRPRCGQEAPIRLVVAAAIFARTAASILALSAGLRLRGAAPSNAGADRRHTNAARLAAFAVRHFEMTMKSYDWPSVK